LNLESVKKTSELYRLEREQKVFIATFLKFAMKAELLV